MRIHRLFKVLVVGGATMAGAVAGCNAPAGTDPGATDGRAPMDSAGGDVAVADTARGPDTVGVRDTVRADGVSSWMSWWVDPMEDAGVTVEDGAVGSDGRDAMAADTATTTSDDAGTSAAGDATDGGAGDGVFAWLSWA